jgi:hypothetical protein
MFHLMSLNPDGLPVYFTKPYPAEPPPFFESHQTTPDRRYARRFRLTDLRIYFSRTPDGDPSRRIVSVGCCTDKSLAAVTTMRQRWLENPSPYVIYSAGLTKHVLDKHGRFTSLNDDTVCIESRTAARKRAKSAVGVHSRSLVVAVQNDILDLLDELQHQAVTISEQPRDAYVVVADGQGRAANVSFDSLGALCEDPSRFLLCNTYAQAMYLRQSLAVLHRARSCPHVDGDFALLRVPDIRNPWEWAPHGYVPRSGASPDSQEAIAAAGPGSRLFVRADVRDYRVLHTHRGVHFCVACVAASADPEGRSGLFGRHLVPELRFICKEEIRLAYNQLESVSADGRRMIALE